jgi:hypothetical protein
MASDTLTQEENADEVPASPGGVMAIRLVLEILEALATRPSVGVTELSKQLDTTKARVFCEPWSTSVTRFRTWAASGMRRGRA